MKSRFLVESIISLLFVFISTYFVYNYLQKSTDFWNAQNIWSLVLAIGWIIVSMGYYHQGWLIHSGHNTKNVSVLLPTAVFFIQCILFIKGIYYKDWSLIWGALVVNSGVLFCLYEIVKNHGLSFRR